uniref:Uncharacterized protein n=1 Tax=Anguilla anguilla TaxID=7936 RepID=A0A0E9W909_ANGAN
MSLATRQAQKCFLFEKHFTDNRLHSSA